MSVVPRSLCAVDGSLYIPTDKASLMHAMEKYESGRTQSTSAPSVAEDLEEDSQHKVLIVDAMAVLQGMKKTANMKKLSDQIDAFIQRIQMMMSGYDEGKVVFDRYVDLSLKNMTRQKR